MAQISNTPEGEALKAIIESIDLAINLNNQKMTENSDDSSHLIYESQLEAFVELRKGVRHILNQAGLDY